MTTFCKTVIPTADYKEKETRGARTVLHFGATEKDGLTECAEAIVAAGYDEAAVTAEYEAWQAAQEAQELKAAKARKTAEINAYDVSDAVNSFTITATGGTAIQYWLNASKRSQLRTGIEAVKAEGGTDYTLDLREYGTSITAGCDKLLAMMSKLEAYAVESYNVTSTHLAAVAKLTTVSDVEAYDITAGYPEKLTIDLSE